MLADILARWGLLDAYEVKVLSQQNTNMPPT